MLAAWAALALAVLSKGLIGIVLPGAALVLYTLLTRDWTLWRRLHLGHGRAAVPRDRGAVVRRRVESATPSSSISSSSTSISRASSPTKPSATAPWWYFVPIFAVGILPWLTLFAWTAKRSWTDAPADRNGFCWQRFALVWAAFIFVFFSLSGSKLSSYILPMFPALALVIAWQLVTIDDDAAAGGCRCH